MKRNFLVTQLFILIFLGFNLSISGQPLKRNNIKTIINGKTWVPQTSIKSAEQFFLKKMNLKGNFFFKSTEFKDLKFAYDLSKEEIITAIKTVVNTERNIVVNKFFLEGFTVIDSGSEFNFLRGDLIHPVLKPNSYYQIKKFNKLKYIIKREKHKTLKSDQSREFKYVTANSIYVVKNQNLININNKGDILRLFPLQKKEMKTFIRSHKLKIGTKTPLDAIVLLSHFDI